MSHEKNEALDHVEVAVPVPKTDGRRLGRLAISDADINIRLLSRLAETAITSGDVKTAVEAVRACTTEAENLYRIAVAERSAAAASTRAAAEQQARALAMQEAATAATRAAAEQQARALAAHEAATAQQARASIMQNEATALHARAVAIRDAANQAMAEATEERRRADQRKRTAPRRLRVTDVNGLDLRPDPSLAQTSAEYIEAVRQFRVWAGNPSFRDIAKRCGGRPVASTVCKILQGDELPVRFEPIDAIIIACGATDEDRQRFATAWRRLVLPGHRTPSVLHVLPEETRMIEASQ